MKFIHFPDPDPSYHNKVYSIAVNGVVVKKIIGVSKALRYFKGKLYDNFGSKISITNVVSNKTIKTFG